MPLVHLAVAAALALHAPPLAPHAPRLPLLARTRPPLLCAPSITLTVDLGATSEDVTLSSGADAAAIARDIGGRHAFGEEDEAELEAYLYARWLDAAEPPPPPYVGPSPPPGEPLRGVVCSIELPDAGLVLEVAESVALAGVEAGDGDPGRGLFVRCMEGVAEVTLDAGTAVCGYAAGRMRRAADSAGGKTVAFRLKEPSTSVFFEQQLHTVGALCAEPSAAAAPVEAIAGHTLVRAADGRVEAVEADAAWEGERYFVPDAAQPPPSIMTLGQMANDLGLGAEAEAAGSYEAAAAERNVLVLVQRLERDAAAPSLLVPSRPVVALARDVTFSNAAPMELGCTYGGGYWSAWAES